MSIFCMQNNGYKFWKPKVGGREHPFGNNYIYKYCYSINANSYLLQNVKICTFAHLKILLKLTINLIWSRSLLNIHLVYNGQIDYLL